MRQRLENRRPSATRRINHNGETIHITVGYDIDTGLPREVFANGWKFGSDAQRNTESACKVVSVALQCGVDPREMARTLEKDEVVGAILSVVCDEWTTP